MNRDTFYILFAIFVGACWWPLFKIFAWWFIPRWNLIDFGLLGECFA